MRALVREFSGAPDGTPLPKLRAKRNFATPLQAKLCAQPNDVLFNDMVLRESATADGSRRLSAPRAKPRVTVRTSCGADPDGFPCQRRCPKSGVKLKEVERNCHRSCLLQCPLYGSHPSWANIEQFVFSVEMTCLGKCHLQP
jgi:hypothetical protein